MRSTKRWATDSIDMNIGDYLIHQPSGTVWIIRNLVGGSGQIELVGEKKMISFENWVPKLPDGWEIAQLPAVTKAEFDKALNCGKLPTT